MAPRSLKIKNESNYFWNDIAYLDKFDDKQIKVNKRESRVSTDIYYITYKVIKPQENISSINPLYITVKDLIGFVENIEGLSDRYLVVDMMAS